MVQRGIKVLRLLFFTPLNLITALDYRLTGKHPRMANLTRILGGLFILCLAVVIPSTHTLDRQWCCYSSDTGWYDVSHGTCDNPESSIPNRQDCTAFSVNLANLTPYLFSGFVLASLCACAMWRYHEFSIDLTENLYQDMESVRDRLQQHHGSHRAMPLAYEYTYLVEQNAKDYINQPDFDEHSDPAAVLIDRTRIFLLDFTVWPVGIFLMILQVSWLRLFFHWGTWFFFILFSVVHFGILLPTYTDTCCIGPSLQAYIDSNHVQRSDIGVCSDSNSVASRYGGALPCGIKHWPAGLYVTLFFFCVALLGCVVSTLHMLVSYYEHTLDLLQIGINALLRDTEQKMDASAQANRKAVHELTPKEVFGAHSHQHVRTFVDHLNTSK